MTSERSNRRLTKLDASRVMAVPLSIVDALIEQRAIPAILGARDLESFFRDGLIRLYRTEATAPNEVPYAEIEIPSRPVEPETPAEPEESVIPTGDEVRAVIPKRRKPNLRVAPRYEPRRQIGGSFREVKFNILQISSTGLRIRHNETLRPGDEARVSFALMKPARSVLFRARVVWTSIAQSRDAASFCISGLTITTNREQLRLALEAMKKSHDVQTEGQSTGTNRTPPALVGLSDDDVASIIRANRKLSTDPVEASRWYARARFALADPDVRRAAPMRARDREEVLGIWEYLGRKVEIGAISSVVNWLRQTRSAAAV